MKKLMVLMLVLCAVPAMAAVQLTATQVGETNEIEIGYVADANVSGFALKVTATDGTIEDVTNYHVGESAAEKGYGIFPGTIDINDAGEVEAYGSPVAPSTAPGADGTGIGTDTVILEMGALYVDNNAPDLSGTLCSVIVSEGTTELCVDADTPLRGGVVYTDATQAEVDLTEACVSLEAAVCVGDIDGNGYVTKADISALVSYLINNASAPNWYVASDDPNYNPAADVDGNDYVTKADISALISYLINNASAPNWYIPCQ